MPKCGPRCKIGYHKLFNYILKLPIQISEFERWVQD